MAAVGPGPPDSAAVLVTSTLCPSILRPSSASSAGSRTALSPIRMTVSGDDVWIASGLSRSPLGEHRGPRRQPQHRHHLGAAGDGLVEPGAVVADGRRDVEVAEGERQHRLRADEVRKRLSQPALRWRAPAPAPWARVRRGGRGEGVQPPGARSARRPPRRALAVSRRAPAAVLGRAPRSGCWGRADAARGLPRASRVSATSTAGSTSQLYGVASAESAMSSTPSRLPPSPSRSPTGRARRSCRRR